MLISSVHQDYSAVGEAYTEINTVSGSMESGC